MKKLFKNLVDKLPYVSTLKKELSLYKTLFPPGHYYSPVPTPQQIAKRKTELLRSIPKEKIKGIYFNEKEQLYWLEAIKKYYTELPFVHNKKEGLRYYFDNKFYPHSDAIFLYGIIRHLCPKKIIEIGCGYSSSVILDTNQYFLNNHIKCFFIDPHLERLKSLMIKEDIKNNSLIECEVQDIDLDFFMQLEENDILCIDSSHISKTGSDVNYLIFDVLPSLQNGVIIHFHDIFYPFEYPQQLLSEGYFFNEGYLLRAFLQYNMHFKIIAFNTFLEYYHKDWFRIHMPLCLKTQGASIWLKKV